MIRSDYLLRMIEEFMAALSRIRALKRGQRWDEASGELDTEFQKLVGIGARELVRLSDTELLARLVREGPTQTVREKTMVLTTLLAEAGDVAVAGGRGAEGRQYHLKALHLLLDVLGRGEVLEWPEFVPKVGMLREALDDPLPPQTQAMLMQHYERTGEFAKAEDALFALLDSDPGNDKIVSFGMDFYRRLQSKADAQLDEGGLPRVEVEEGLLALQSKSGIGR